MNSWFGGAILECIDRAADGLASRQAPDGFWRDYWLKPGASEDWVTACCIVALAREPASSMHVEAARVAGRALHSAGRPGGWGYNRDTVADADSSAWALRSLAALGYVSRGTAEALLRTYLDANARARTFLPPEQAGNWGLPHADVTPLVGIALLAIEGSTPLSTRVRAAVLADQAADGAWRSFWWAGDAYATARSLEFLRLSGGIPRERSRAALGWLRNHSVATHCLDAAHLLTICALLGHSADYCLDLLFESQCADGLWPPSPALLTPPQEGDFSTAEESARNYDSQRILGSAMVLMALKLWWQGARSNHLGMRQRRITYGGG